VSTEGAYQDFTSSLSVNMEKFREQMSEDTKFGEHRIVLTSGGMDMPEPIGLKLVPVYEALESYFYVVSDGRSGLPCKHTTSLLRDRQDNLQRILKEYPRLKRSKTPVDPPVRIPLTWPQGTYGLPMTTSGCPKGAGFKWHYGYRYHENEVGNEWSRPYDLGGRKSVWTNEQAFCMKTQERGTEYDLTWGPGQFCIFKKGNCPQGSSIFNSTGFREGYIRWDVENRQR